MKKKMIKIYSKRRERQRLKAGDEFLDIDKNEMHASENVCVWERERKKERVCVCEIEREER